MATIKGIKNRLAAAGRALGGDYTSEKNGSKPKDKLKASQRVNAVSRNRINSGRLTAKSLL